jgi:NAD dependent epimerase/dehydratase family
VIPALQSRGFSVRGQYSRKPGTTQGVEWRRMNFLQSLDFNPLLQGCDAVVHLAAELSDVSRMDRVNVEATRILLAAAQSEGIRYFGHASSIVVYGSPRQRLVDETTPILNPFASMVRQYNAEPYMLEYARTRRSLNLRFVTSIRKLMSISIGRPWWLVWIACLKPAIGVLPANLELLTDERSISMHQIRRRRLPTSSHGAFRSIRAGHGSKLTTFAIKTVKLFARFSIRPTKGLAILATGCG